MPLYTDTYDSLAALAAAGERHRFELHDAWGGFRGVDSWAEAKDLAIHGWQGVEAEAMAIAESAVETVEADHEQLGFAAVWDTTGCEVDVGRYLIGEPECMIDYQAVPATRVGRVITLCASVSISSVVSEESLKRRGFGIAALAFALGRLGFAIEMWADVSVAPMLGDGATARIRVLVKGANDELDPSKIMTAFAHPAMLRTLVFAAEHEFPEQVQKEVGVGRYYGSPRDPVEDMPEGTIYLPCVCTDRDIPDPEVMLRRQLKALGIIS